VRQSVELTSPAVIPGSMAAVGHPSALTAQLLEAALSRLAPQTSSTQKDLIVVSTASLSDENENSTFGAHDEGDSLTKGTNVPRHGVHARVPRLTLSAFRRPENTVRLTGADPLRRLEDDYDLHAPGCGVLGHGSFSTVRLAASRSSPGLHVAVKSIAKVDALRSRRLRSASDRGMDEWDILRTMRNHPHIIHLYDVYETNEEIHLVTEYCAGGELFDAIQRRHNRGAHGSRRGHYSEYQASRIMMQLLSAVSDLHALDIVHRDIKPENIVLVDPLHHDDDDTAIKVKLCDFGVARSIFRNSRSIMTLAVTPSENRDSNESPRDELSPLTPARARAFSMLGSNYYVAPEICYGSPYDPAVDVYSLGVTLYILLCGLPPVFADDANEEDSRHVIFPEAYWHGTSESAKSLLLKMLDPEPSSRITASEALRDAWVLQSDSPVSSRQRGSQVRSSLSPVRRGSMRRSSLLSLVVDPSSSMTTRATNLALVRSRLYQYKLSPSYCDDESIIECDAPVTDDAGSKRTGDNGCIVNGAGPGCLRKRARVSSGMQGALALHMRSASVTGASLALADLYSGASLAVPLAGDSCHTLPPDGTNDSNSFRGSPPPILAASAPSLSLSQSFPTPLSV
jgi:serine/threonine protein kinase